MEAMENKTKHPNYYEIGLSSNGKYLVRIQ